MRAVYVSLAVALALDASSFHLGEHVIHESRARDPVDWEVTRHPNALTTLPLRIGLKQQNIENIEAMLMAVSHPESPAYGQYWSTKRVVDTFSPTGDTVRSVVQWLTDFGFSKDKVKISGSRGWVQVHATIAEVEQLLRTEYEVYTQVGTGEKQIGCKTYSIPRHLQRHVDLIRPTVHFKHRPSSSRIGERVEDVGPRMMSLKSLPNPSLDTCNSMITLDCLRALYDIEYTPVSTNKNTFGIVEFTPQAYLDDDLDLFFAKFSPSLVGARPVPVLIDGAIVQTEMQNSTLNAESDLDLEYAMGLTAPQPVTLLQLGDLVEGAGFDNWLDAVDGSFCTFEGGDDPIQDGIYPDPLPGGFKGPEDCGIIQPPNVVSISASQDESTATAAFANRQCAEYAKLGLMGTSVLYASGDFGVAGTNNACLDADGASGNNGTRFNPQFPATCPFVTAVGATQVNPGAKVTDPESACMQKIFSGGGFSNIFGMPDYQAEAVSSFLNNHPPPYTAEQFNNSGTSRGLPDISANGANYVIGVNGQFHLVFGTSASAPVFASMITLLNDARIAAGKGPVGFVNPAVYSQRFKSAFNDITNGTNPGCGTEGFSATEGWDPVTGVGTPSLAKLMHLFLDLP